MFEPGDFIRFIYTGAKAEIMEDHLDGSYSVWLIEDNEESIAFEDDIIPEKQFNGVKESDAQKEKPQKIKQLKRLSTEALFFSQEELEKKYSIVKPKKKATTVSAKEGTPIPDFNRPTFKHNKGTDSGCHIALIQVDHDEYAIYVINDTKLSHNIHFELQLQGNTNSTFKIMLPANDYIAVGALKKADFNDSPKAIIVIPAVDVAYTLKIKYLKVIKDNRILPIVGTKGFFATIYTNKTLKKAADLGLYTTSQHKKRNSRGNFIPKQVSVLKHAQFDRKKDLHFNNLVDDPTLWAPEDILPLQLDELDRYITDAVYHSIEEVFIIHGKGSGRLKEEVHRYLGQHPHVDNFKNEMHPIYEFGATQVYLKKQ